MAYFHGESSRAKDMDLSQSSLSILQRLDECGVPKEQLDQLQPGLVAFLKENKDMLKDIVKAILPTKDDAIEALAEAELDTEEEEEEDDEEEEEEDEEQEESSSNTALEYLFRESIEWLQWLMFEDEPDECLKRLAKRSVGERGVCGAVWGKKSIAYRCKTCESDPTCAICVSCFRNGNHKDHDYSTIRVVSGVCDCGNETAWKREGFCSEHEGVQQIKLLPEDIERSVGAVLDHLFSYWDDTLEAAEDEMGSSEDRKVGRALTRAVVEMLLIFSQHSDSLSRFVSKRMFPLLINHMVEAEKLLDRKVKKKLHKLLLKFIGVGDELFKYNFANKFLTYYQETIKECIRRGDHFLIQKYKFVSTFSIQVFTDPTLTPRLVRELNLLGRLLGYLEDLLRSCFGEEGHLQSGKLEELCDAIKRLIEDTHSVVSHAEVLKYIVHEQPSFIKIWMQLLVCIQGIDPRKRETGVHVEGQWNMMSFPFNLGNFTADVYTLLVNEAFSAEEIKSTFDGDTQMAYEATDNRIGVSVNSLYCITSFTCECLEAIENWLDPVNSSSKDFSSRTERLRLLNLSDPPQDIAYDVSSQDISVHIPLHRLISVVLHKALKNCYGDTGALEMSSLSSASPSFSGHFDEFFGQILRGCQPTGFSVYMMEHPLRIKVFFAQIRAGMWKKNGDTDMKKYWKYFQAWRSEQRLELDTFLLQCCATFAPPDLFVNRILERFGLSNYLSLNLEQSADEYEPLLVKEMLTLIIQIVIERRFCGFSTAQSLRRELVYKLAAVEGATHSELLKSFPEDLHGNDQLQKILDSVADYSKPSKTKQGNYSLRKTCWEELDLYHPRWNTEDLQSAEQRYLTACNVSAWSVQLPRWTDALYPPLHGISRIATSRVTMEIVRAVLYYAVSSENSSQSRAPEEVVFKALHLLSLGLDICSLQRQTSDSIPLLALATQEISAGTTLLSLLVSLKSKHGKKAVGLSSLVANLLEKLEELNDGCKMELQRLASESVTGPIPNTDAHEPDPISVAEELRREKGRKKRAAVEEKYSGAMSNFLKSVVKPEEKSKFLEVLDEPEEMVPSVCCLCKDPNSKSPLSFLILLQKSRLGSFVERRGLVSWEQAHPSDRDPSSSKTAEKTKCDGIHVSSCGHAFHHDCYVSYLSSSQARSQGTGVLDLEQGEFLCPTCRGLANAVLPAFFSDSSNKVGKQQMMTLSSGCTSEITNVLHLKEALYLLQSAGDMVGMSEKRNDFSLETHASLEPVFNALGRKLFGDKHKTYLASQRISYSMILWDTLKYSLISTEIAARGGRSDTSSAGTSTSLPTSTAELEALYRDLESSSGFILSLLLRVVDNTRSDEDSLQRVRGIQLFAQSIFPGVSTDMISTDTDDQTDEGVEYPDIQCWRRAADPVLAHDPFSSLMWIFFSLPSPFPSSEECFICLVHLFYAVCVIQALITYMGKYDITEFGDNTLVSDLREKVQEYGFARQFFVSKYIDDSSCQPEDMIRKLTHPYLRRCALLWKLLTSSTAAPTFDGSHKRIRLPTVELKEVEELEQLFQIPKLDFILKDDMMRNLGLQWFFHFKGEYETRHYGHTLHTTPAIPFKLICLPYNYQDLLVRYLKKKCPECGEDQKEHLLCLQCGRLCSPDWSYGCGKTWFEHHAKSCSAGIGVFLHIEETTILLSTSPGQASWPSLYLDKYGDEDRGMRRGKPLHLNEERYADLTNLVVSHGVAQRIASHGKATIRIDALFL